ncbi:alpha/beta hydrolase [Paenibacillus eucommiae]|uniref:Pimeloyl-ACP methyl ester carboxylesterase n=1 Tax=Paenibacillus eucommiae TaxID=1355755 RepID=A0ABS4IYP3_9BACL|nr:alpha/beta fold hydrolase [Paenibacillus eucommiae]MBP1992708.1 pimeloyl-ACP methyl ester carboxylesterase [Paenibacillus eucommiae]
MIWLVTCTLLVLLLGMLGISLYVGWNLTHPARRLLEESPSLYGIAYDNMEFHSRTKDVLLKGWFLPCALNSTHSEPKMTLILSHGYAGNRLEKGLPALALAKSLVANGFHVLMFDFRNSGESEGRLTTIGMLEKQDLLGAIDWVKEHQPGKIGLIGFSMGATTSLLAAAEEPEIVGVVADSPFSQLKPYLHKNLSVWSRLPHFPFTPLIMAILPVLTGIDTRQVDAFAACERIHPRPLLFIHSRDDQAIPYTQSERMWSQHKGSFEFWQTANVGHVGTYHSYPDEYTSRVLGFFNNLLI